ncbi:MAG: hypothetical protein ABIK28_23985 [Planctomycetota bacterium]
MGADEFHPHFYCTGDFTPGGHVQGNLVPTHIPMTSPVPSDLFMQGMAGLTTKALTHLFVLEVR